MRDRIVTFFDSARAWVLLATGAGVLFWLDPSAADSLAPKAFFFVAAASCLSALALVRLAWGLKISLPRPKFGLVLLALVASQLLATALSSSPLRSETFLDAWILAVLFFFAAYDWMRDVQRQEFFLKGCCVVLGLACAWGLTQRFGMRLGPMDAASEVTFGNRISAGFGNPNFFAGFLALSLPMALWLALRKPAAWVLVAAGALALLSTGCKAAWMAAAFEYFAFGHLTWHASQEATERKRFLMRWAGFGWGVVLLGLLLLPGARQRLVEGLRPSNASVQFRVETWKGALAAFAASPWVGHGPGSFSAVYPAYRPPAAMAVQVQHSYEVTHAENWVLEILVESGLLGLVALSLCFWLLLKPLWRAGLEGDRLATVLFMSLAGSLVCNLAALDLFLPSTFFVFILLAALAVRRYGGRGVEFGLKTPPYSVALFSTCFLLLSAWPGLEAWARWQASRTLFQAESFSKAGKFDPAVELYDSALQGDPSNIEALYFKGASLLDGGHPDQALPIFNAVQALAPDYVLVHDKKARAYQALGDATDAAAEWERQLQLDPWWLPGVESLSGLYASHGRLPDAERVLENAAAHFPDNADVARNLTEIQKAIAMRRL